MIFKDFQKPFKLQNQILLLLLLSSIIPVSIVGAYGIASSTSALSNLAENNLQKQVDDEAEKIQAVLQGITDDVLFLSKTPEVKGIIASGDRNSSNWNKQLQGIFASLIETKPFYMQLRYIDENGQEIVRVDSDGANVKVISQAELQNKKERPYFGETMKLSPGIVYTSAVELNQERGQIERPFKPTIRYSTPIVDSTGTKRGIIIANVLANKFIKIVEEADASEKEEALLVDQNGYYISHPKPEKEWGVDLKKNEKLSKDYPPEIAQQILNNKQGLISEGTDQLIAYQRIVPNPNQSEYLVAITQSPKNTIFASVNWLKIVASVIILASIATVLPLGIFRARQLTNLIKQLINGISASSQQSFSALEQQERIASQQSTSVNETTTTMDELEASFRQSSEQAKAAVAAAQQVLQLTESGTEAVEKNMEGMFVLEKKVGAIAEQMLHLSEQANQIGSISQFVSDLANQTNMLALNSAVEAVRAGEHGKGFSVVANEIRRLADQSQRSAEKIYILVSEIQSAVSSTVMMTEEGTKTVTAGVEIAQKTEQAFVGVEQAVNKVVLNNQQISLNLKQQLDGIQQVVQAMDNINRGAKETAIGINQTKLNTQQLNEIALELKQVV
ncbi:methyl-accepting chemotaxis protein [Iningainema tapete]|uniref:Methyl-accepting chemotaxis protein n=1 Tax=Iningainema tapete BLCC-T55 TaxID=2748662 RepID=A0A8J6XZC5_9CYAN|nr:methyl-accepting chemotaxis protein [Iningainema tapete]MBD2775993.1 methyl-accepting chemotaxis protein [Iningainema tapete BLCC-T55]